MLGLLEFKKKPFQGMKDLFEQLSVKQNPETLFITCSDSRIVPSLITQADPGDLFSIRNIGNIIPPYPSSFSEAAALEYALNVLDIKDIIICGHSNCGAMKGLLTPHIEDQLPGVASWLGHSHAVLEEMKAERTTELSDPARELEIATKKNIVHQMNHLKTYPLIKAKMERKELTIHGWYYELVKGQVFIYEQELNEFINLEYALERALESRKNKILSGVSMNYLQKMLPLKSEAEYLHLMELMIKLQDNILPIWESIKKPVTKKLWEELGGFYDSLDDEKFKAMVESSTSFRLPALEEFRDSISFIDNNTSKSPLLSSSIFIKRTNDVSKLSIIPENAELTETPEEYVLQNTGSL